MKKGLKIKPKGYWTKARVLAQAKKYKYASIWHKECRSSYSAARRNGWMNESKKFLINKNKKYSQEEIVDIAVKYGNCKNWIKNDYSSFNYARRNGLYDIAREYLTPLSLKITKENVFAMAKEYNTRSEFSYQAPSYYAKARKNGWLNECCKHMLETKDVIKLFRKLKWTEKTIMEEAARHEKLNDLLKVGGIKSAIKRLKLKNKIKKNIKSGVYCKWNFHTVKNEALKYKTKHEFAKESGGAYNCAIRNGWMKKICNHMMTRKELAEKNRMIWFHDKIVEAILECKTKSNLMKKYPGAMNRIRLNPKKYDYLFTPIMLNIEARMLHPKIEKILKKNSIAYLHEFIFRDGKEWIRPDFIFENKRTTYIIEAKTSASYKKSSNREIENQVIKQIEYIKRYYPDRRIVHILLSEEGYIKCTKSNYSMSLKEFDFFLKTFRYKKNVKNMHAKSHMGLAIKIRKEYFKKFFNYSISSG